MKATQKLAERKREREGIKKEGIAETSLSRLAYPSSSASSKQKRRRRRRREEIFATQKRLIESALKRSEEMLVANSFDLWQKDSFFSAAEEVQHSADIMESSFRTWDRQNNSQLSRDLQTALGTAKWQLEEFEKAVRLSYTRSRVDNFTMARHSQFVDVIHTQISRVETAFQESFAHQPLRWVHLNEDECNDLAAFLSGPPPATSPHAKPGTSRNSSSNNSSRRKNSPVKHKGLLNAEAASALDIPYCTNGSADVTGSSGRECFGSGDGSCCQAADMEMMDAKRSWNSPDVGGAWKIVIPDENEQDRALVPCLDATPKEKGYSKSVFSRQRCGDRSDAKGGMLCYSNFKGIRWINKVLRQIGGCQRQVQSHPYVRLTSFRLKLALLLIFFLIVPFLLYST